ncbi:MAG TPA: hypothetical protein VJT31_01685 [Rugosimonospora sp.]|nr:hypothetical protein [Rugosimonospora sp.]
MTAWDDYLAAAQRLDAARREAASVVAEQAAAAKAAREQLAGVRQRAARQRTRLVAVAKTEGVPAPDETVAAAELAAAEHAVGTTHPPVTPVAVSAALGETVATMDTTDAILSTLEDSGLRRLRRARNPLVYLSFAAVSVLLPLITFHAAASKFVLIPTIGCAATLPIMGYGLAWVTVGLRHGSGPVRRTPVLGAAVTVGTVVALYTLYLVLALVHAF